MTYISGKITGLDLDFARFTFEATQIKLFPINTIQPFEIRPVFGVSNWFFHMISDIIALTKCDSIYMMSNWEDSKGARVELFFAKLFKIDIYYEKNRNERVESSRTDNITR